MARCLESRQVEIISRHWPTGELVRADSHANPNIRVGYDSLAA